MSADRVRYSAELPEAEEYLRLFETTGWNEMYRQSADTLLLALDRSWSVVTAWHGDTLVGVGRALSDGVQYAVIFDMIVEPGRQGRGIGSGLLRRLLARCDEAGIRDVLLFAAEGVRGFYERHGFRARPESAPGMIRRRVPEPD